MLYGIIILIITFFLIFFLERKGVRIIIRIMTASIGVVIITMIAVSEHVSNDIKTAFAVNDSTARTLVKWTNGNNDFLRAVTANLDDSKNSTLLKQAINDAISLQVDCIGRSLILPQYDTAKYLDKINQLTKQLNQGHN